MTLKIKVKVTSFELIQDLYVINTLFKFEDKIQNTSKVIVFTRNHKDDTDDADAEDGSKNSMSPFWLRGRHNLYFWHLVIMVKKIGPHVPSVYEANDMFDKNHPYF